MAFLPTILAVAPFALFLILLFWKKSRLIWVSFASLILVVALAAFYWRVYPQFLIGSIEKGFFVALDIFFIIFGAIFFLEILKEIKIIENIGSFLESISKDLRIQVILLAWFFENFLEGTAGFGTPATVVAPLLIGLGISPLNSVIITLLGNSSAGVFGAAGTPIKIGFGDLASANLPIKASLLNMVGILVPMFMLWLLTVGKKEGKRDFIETLPFALWSGIVFAGSSILTVFLGQEFPSIVGSLLGLGIVLFTIKIGLFVPKSESGFIHKERTKATLPLKKALFPYAFLIVLLVVGKFVIGSRGIVLPILIKHTFGFFNPGFAFIIAGLAVALLFRVSRRIFSNSLNVAARKSTNPFLVIVFMSSIAQIMVNSVHNAAGFFSMIDILAVNIKNAFLPFWAPFIGAFGSFLTGSVTISNLMFGNFLATTARDLSFNVESVLALAVVGAAAGNMIALADILVAEAVVGLKHQERAVLKGVILPCLISVVIVGVVGMLVL